MNCLPCRQLPMERIRCSISSGATVSYTHLDVYKRQILYLLNKRMLREKVRKDVQKVVVCHTGDKINNNVVGIVQISTDLSLIHISWTERL